MNKVEVDSEVCDNHTGSGASMSCGEMYNCCDCGTDEQDDGCGCAYCWSCNACEVCLNEE